MRAKIVITANLLEENDFLKDKIINSIEKINDNLSVIYYENQKVNTINVSGLTEKEKSNFINLYHKLKTL